MLWVQTIFDFIFCFNTFWTGRIHLVPQNSTKQILNFTCDLRLLENIPLTFSQTSHNISSTDIILNINTLLISDADGPPAIVTLSLLINDYLLLTY